MTLANNGGDQALRLLGNGARRIAFSQSVSTVSICFSQSGLYLNHHVTCSVLFCDERPHVDNPLRFKIDPFSKRHLAFLIRLVWRVCFVPKPEVAIQMEIEPAPSRRKGRISHLYVYRQQIDERQCLNLNGG